MLPLLSSELSFSIKISCSWNIDWGPKEEANIYFPPTITGLKKALTVELIESLGNCLRALVVGGPIFFWVSKSSMLARSFLSTSVFAFLALSLVFFKLNQYLSYLLSYDEHLFIICSFNYLNLRFPSVSHYLFMNAWAESCLFIGALIINYSYESGNEYQKGVSDIR